MESKTKQALRWLNESTDRTQYAASRIFGVAQSALSVALQKQAKNVRLWKVHGAAIEQKEATGNSKHVMHIPTSEHIAALRGREVMKQMVGRVGCRPEYPMTKMDDALDWLDVNGGTIKAAAARTGVSVQGVYAGRRVRDARARALRTMGAPMCEIIAKHIEDNPGKSAYEIATYYSMPMHVLRDAMTARATERRCAAMGREPSERQVALEEAARIAETVGGEYGAHIATAIRALPASA